MNTSGQFMISQNSLEQVGTFLIAYGSSKYCSGFGFNEMNSSRISQYGSRCLRNSLRQLEVTQDLLQIIEQLRISHNGLRFLRIGAFRRMDQDVSGITYNSSKCCSGFAHDRINISCRIFKQLRMGQNFSEWIRISQDGLAFLRMGQDVSGIA